MDKEVSAAEEQCTQQLANMVTARTGSNSSTVQKVAGIAAAGQSREKVTPRDR